MELTGRLIDCSVDILSGKLKVTFEVEEKNELMKKFDELKNKVLSIKVGLKKKKRSKDANSYMWVLIGKLEEELSKNDEKVTKDLIYKDYIKHYGRSIEYQIPEEAVTAMTTVWTAYGLGWFCEIVDDGAVENTKVIRFYYGSSCYSSSRMSRLIKAVVADCETLGISTLTPQEIELLIDKWGEEKSKA